MLGEWGGGLTTDTDRWGSARRAIAEALKLSLAIAPGCSPWPALVGLGGVLPHWAPQERQERQGGWVPPRAAPPLPPLVAPEMLEGARLRGKMERERHRAIDEARREVDEALVRQLKRRWPHGRGVPS